MGNCQAADAATVVIQHPGGRIERIHWSLIARQVMASNPGHYVAIIITSEPPASRSTRNAATAPVKHLKLLRPDDTLHIGHLYRLISFEEILRDFVWKNNGRLGRLLVAGKEKNHRSAKDVSGDGAASSANCSSPAMIISLYLDVTSRCEDFLRTRLRPQCADCVPQLPSFHRYNGDDEARNRAGVAPQVLPSLRPRQWKPALQSIAEVVGS